MNLGNLNNILILIICCTAACYITDAQTITKTVIIDDYAIEVNAWDVSSGLPSIHITNVIESKSGHLFMYAPKEGLYVFDGNSVRFLNAPYLADSKFKLPRNQQVFFHEDQKGNIWIIPSLSLERISIYTPTGRTGKDFSSYTGISSDSIKLIGNISGVLFLENRLYFYSNEKKEIWRCDTTLDRVFKLDFLPNKDYKIPIPPFDKTLFYDYKDRVFKRSNQRYLYTDHTLPLENLAKNFYLVWENYDTGNNMSLYDGNKVIINDFIDVFKQKVNLELSGIQNVRSKENSFFLTSQTHLIRLTIKKNKFKTIDFKSKSPSVRLIHDFNPDLLFVSSYSGIFFINKKNFDVQASPIGFHNNFFCIRDLIKTDQSYWFSTEHGLYSSASRYEYDALFRKSYSKSIENELLHFPKRKEIYVAGNDGLKRIQYNQSEELENIALKDHLVYTLIQSKDQDFWAGYDDGLYNHTEKKSYLAGFNVHHIYEDDNDTFWLATNKGLLKWKIGHSDYKIYDTSNGFTNNTIHCVYPDKFENLWMSSNYGLIKFNKNSHLVKVYFKENGLPNDEFNQYAHYQDEKGHLYLGGVQGVVMFDPNSISSKNNDVLFPISPVILEVYDSKNELCFQQNLNTSSNSDKIQIPSNSYRIELIYDHPYFGESVNIEREWKTSSLYNEWTPMEDNKVVFHFLNYGKERLEIRAYRSGDIIQKSSFELEIEKPIPFYKTSLFLVTLILLLVILSYLIARYIGWYEQEKLYRLVKEQTSDIEKQKVKIAEQKEELQKINNYKSRFFKNISHDFRTPISIILGLAERFENNKKIPANILQQISKIKENTLQLNNLTNQIFELSKAENKQLKLRESTVEWGRFFRNIVQSFEPIAESKQIELRITALNTQLLYLSLDQNKTEQLIRNLIDNALKFTPPLGKVFLYSKEEPETIILKVADSGPGIKDKEKQKIFDRYYQGKNTDHFHVTGLGIGLALCKEYVELMGGKISIIDSPLKGACFQLVLPKKLSNEQPEMSPLKHQICMTQIEYAKPKTVLNYRKPCLLVVEDNHDLLNFYKEELSNDYTLLLASNGSQALEISKKSHLNIDLIISDVMMPDMNGFQLLEFFKSTAQYRSIPFILITALVADSHKLNALKIGVDAYLTKPFSIVELSTRIKNLLHYKQLRKEYKNELGLENATNIESEPPQTLNSLSPLQREWLSKLENIINDRIDDPNLKINTISSILQVSERTLRNKIKEYTGLKPSEYIMKIRLSKALNLLQNRHYNTVAEVCYQIGLKNSSNFARLFKAEYGRLPSSYLLR